MGWVRGIIIILAASQAGAMIANGVRAIVFGEYFALRKGARADELAVWEGIVASAGISSRSLGMKLFFILYGSLWLVMTYQFLRQRKWSRVGMMAAVAGSLWYVGIGTPMAITQIFLLSLLPATRVDTTQS